MNNQIKSIESQVYGGRKIWKAVEGLAFEPVTTPFIREVFQAMNGHPLILGFDTIQGRNGRKIRMVYLVHKRKMIPLCWTTRRSKNHSTSASHLIQLLRKILEMVPEGAEVILLGQTEFYEEVLCWVNKNTTWRFVLSNWQTSVLHHPQIF